MTEDRIVLSAVNYEPTFSDNYFKDDFTQITSSQFQNLGVKCPCSGEHIFNNKANFQHQHCKSIKHRLWLKQLNDDKPKMLSHLKELEEKTKNQSKIIAKSHLIITRKDKKIADLNKTIENYENKELDINDDNKDEIEYLKGKIEKIKSKSKKRKKKIDEMKDKLHEANIKIKQKEKELNEASAKIDKILINTEKLNKIQDENEELLKFKLNVESKLEELGKDLFGWQIE